MTSAQVQLSNHQTQWHRICRLEQLVAGVGTRALVAGTQVALFRMTTEQPAQVCALSALDPFTGMAVMDRGIIGCVQGHPVISSPLYKQHFRLDTGACLEDPEARLQVFPVQVVDCWVNVLVS